MAIMQGVSRICASHQWDNRVDLFIVKNFAVTVSLNHLIHITLAKGVFKAEESSYHSVWESGVVTTGLEHVTPSMVFYGSALRQG